MSQTSVLKSNSLRSKLDIDVIIKLGGSAITDKDQFETIKPTSLQTAAQLVSDCLDKGLRVVIVHGAGSFGHHQAKEYRVNQGFNNVEDPDTVRKGFCLTRMSVLKLQHHVTEALLKQGVPAVSLSACGLWKTCAGSVTQSDISSVLELLTSGFVPVLHGDCVLDTGQGCSILSGDTIIKELCIKKRIGKVLFLTDVEGIYNRPPELSGAELIPSIAVSKDGKLLGLPETISMTTAGCDVTGGIRFKLGSAVTIVTEGQCDTPVFICKLGEDLAIQFCLLEDVNRHPQTGTLVYLNNTGLVSPVGS